MDLINLLAFSIYIVTILVTLIAWFKKKQESYKYSKEVLELLFEKEMLLERIQNMLDQQERAKLVESDGFTKFLSDSRDWAFKYIEEVQKAFSDFDNEVSPILKLDDGTFKEISLAYEELKKVLPENEQTPNN